MNPDFFKDFSPLLPTSGSDFESTHKSRDCNRRRRDSTRATRARCVRIDRAKLLQEEGSREQQQLCED